MTEPLSKKSSVRNKIFNYFFDLLFPKNCAGCAKEGNWLCNNCESAIKESKLLINKNSRFKFVFYSLGNYKNKTLSTMVQRFKYSGIIDYGKISAKLLLVKMPKLTGGGYICTSVAMIASKERTRGYNQAQILAREFALLSQNKFIKTLGKTKKIKSQTEMKNRSQRIENIKGAFAVIPGAQEYIRGRDIILFDDVVTTGATINEALKILKRYRPKSIKVLSIAID